MNQSVYLVAIVLVRHLFNRLEKHRLETHSGKAPLEIALHIGIIKYDL